MKKNYSLIFFTLFFLDRISKHLIVRFLKTSYELIPSFLSFELLINRGISWGMLHAQSTGQFLFVSGIILGIIGSLGWYAYQRFQQNKLIFGEVMALAGALSNFYDRIFYHGVIDFIAVSFGFWSFPVFNIADACIVTGVLVMILEQMKEG